MARRDQAEALRRQKDAKQRKLLIVLVPVFLGLAAWQGPPMYKALFSSPAPPPLPPAQTTAAPTDPTAPPTTQQGGTSTTAAPDGLSDTDPLPSAGIDRLISFSRFSARDPFKVTVGQSGAAIGSGTDDSGSSGSDQQATSALFEVNGSSQTVSVGDSFPAGDPTFKLVSLTSEKAVVGLATGTFEGGKETVEVAVGEQLQLVADDGARYTIKLVSVGS
jgi:hypothetical protein